MHLVGRALHHPRAGAGEALAPHQPSLRHRLRHARVQLRVAPGVEDQRVDARARLGHLLDKGTFREFGTLVGGDIAADGIVAGSGLIDGKPVMVGAEDFTTLAGSIGPGGNAKRFRLAELVSG